MKMLKRLGVLSSMAMVAGLSFAGNAVAAQSHTAPVMTRIHAAPAIAADYFWNGRHYVYRWHNRYFNHRRWHNNAWNYY